MSADISLPLDIPNVKVLKTQRKRDGDYIITVESTVEGTRCRKCGRHISKFHGHGRWIKLRHLSILGHRVYIRLRPKRYQCPYCPDEPTTTQRLEWYTPKAPATKAYEDHLLLQLVNSTVEDVSVKEDIGYDTVLGVMGRRIQESVNWEEYDELLVIGIDEIARRKGRRDYLAIITVQQWDGSVAVLAVLPNRKKAAVKRFLQTIPARLRITIMAVCTDMWDGYVNAVTEVLGKEVDIVVDRYHVAKNYRQCADKLRQRVCKRLKQELSAEAYEPLKGVMWPFRKRRDELAQAEQEQLARLFAHAPELETAYTLREALTDIFDGGHTVDEGKSRLRAWRQRVIASGLDCYDSFLTTLYNWWDEIANYFRNRLSSGFVEGLNNKVKTLKRRCYGFLNVTHFYQRLYLDLEGYRLFAHACP
jgi:transposase